MKWKQGRTTAERFWDLVDKREPDECWIWLGAKYQNRYGNFYVGTGKLNRRTVPAHRMSYFIQHGMWPKEVCHSCNNPSCVNPNHLYTDTHSNNIRHAVRDGLVRPPTRKLDAVKIQEIHSLRAAGVLRKTLSKQFDISLRHVDTVLAS